MQVYLSVQDELLKVLAHQEKFSTPGGQADTICDKMVNAEVSCVCVRVIHLCH